MSTRATIEFTDGGHKFYVYRGHDGFPDVILPDIKKVIDLTRNRWSEPEVELLVTAFIGVYFKVEKRLPDYEITEAFHGDESYKYYVRWNKETQMWDFGESV